MDYDIELDSRAFASTRAFSMRTAIREVTSDKAAKNLPRAGKDKLYRV